MYLNPQIYLLQLQELSRKEDDWIWKEKEWTQENTQLNYQLDGLSTSSSRKRKREITWQDILDRKECQPLVNKQTLLRNLEEYGSPLYYSTRSAATQAKWCECWGITGWQDILLDAIVDVSALNLSSQ